jgi:hypothetical protein
MTVAIVGGSVAAIAISTRPSFEDRLFPVSAERGIHVLDWPTLRTIRESRPFEPPLGLVRVAGYMVSTKPLDREGKVATFLLVPDPGNWLHPPHLHPDDVLDIHMQGSKVTRLLTRRAVWVEGCLSPNVPGNDQSLAITAMSVSPLQEEQVRPRH